MKNRILLFLIVSVLAFGCGSDNNSAENENQVFSDSEVVDSPQLAGEPETVIVNKPNLWSVEFEPGSQKEKLKKPESLEIESLSADQLIRFLNQNYEDVQLKLDHISNDTLYAKIPDSDKLTQQLGSTGAYNYLASVVYNLTELNNVKYINLDFKEGDHAMPGVFNRDDFKTLR